MPYINIVPSGTLAIPYRTFPDRDSKRIRPVCPRERTALARARYDLIRGRPDRAEGTRERVTSVDAGKMLAQAALNAHGVSGTENPHQQLDQVRESPIAVRSEPIKDPDPMSSHLAISRRPLQGSFVSAKPSPAATPRKRADHQ